MSMEDVKNSNDGPQTNGDVVVPQERIKRPTRPDDVAQKAAIDELQSSSTCGCPFLFQDFDCRRDLGLPLVGITR